MNIIQQIVVKAGEEIIETIKVHRTAGSSVRIPLAASR